MPRRGARKGGWVPALAYALLLHAVIIVVLVVGLHIVHRDEMPGEVIQAVVERSTPEAEQQARAEEERQRREAEQRRQEQEQARIEAERRQQEQERQRQEAERKQQEELAAKKRREDERRQAQQQRQQQATQALREQLAAEEKARAAAQAARLAPEADKYKAAIRQKVERNWSRPTTSRKGLQCTVRVRLIPGGEVLEVAVVKSSGDAVFDRSVESAVRKASPLPLPEREELFEQFREIEFIFRPTET